MIKVAQIIQFICFISLILYDRILYSNTFRCTALKQSSEIDLSLARHLWNVIAVLCDSIYNMLWVCHYMMCFRHYMLWVCYYMLWFCHYMLWDCYYMLWFRYFKLWVCHYMLWFRHYTLFPYDNSSLL